MAKLYFYYSAMNAGKTTTLLQADFNYRERGLTTLLYTAAVDDRYETGKITSRIGLAAKAYMFEDGTNFYNGFIQKHAQNSIDCILIDEAQFLTAAHVDQLAQICDKHAVPVLCYGLRTDFKGALFTGSERLLAIADELKELKTICKCGSKATMNLRVDAHGKGLKEGAQTEIGGNESYVSMCRKHFVEALS
tara:strand:- start:128765 stop:129340 length:576 start_codon:yes stop_codon:yes gene_type:complete